MLAIIKLYPQFFFSQNRNPKPFQNPNFNSQNPNFNSQHPNFYPKNPSSRQNVKLIAQSSLQLITTTVTTATTSDRGLIFREKVLYLEKLNVNPNKAFRENPNLRNCPLRILKTVEECLSSIGIHKSDMGRILDMLPELLTCDPHDDIYPLLDFLLNEVRIPYHDIQKSILRCPRLLVSSVENRLRPALCFLKELGFVGPHSITCQTTLLLVSSVEDTLLPKVEFLMGLGFTRVEVSNMVVRSPGLLTLSVDKNLKPKVEFFLKEMNGDIAELKRFPQYFSFSLERRIKPRYAMLVELGLELNLEDMLTVSNGGFESMLFKMRLRAIEGKQL